MAAAVFVCLFAAVAAVVTGIVNQELEPELLRRKLLREYSRVTATEQTAAQAAVSEWALPPSAKLTVSALTTV